MSVAICKLAFKRRRRWRRALLRRFANTRKRASARSSPSPINGDASGARWQIAHSVCCRHWRRCCLAVQTPLCQVGCRWRARARARGGEGAQTKISHINYGDTCRRLLVSRARARARARIDKRAGRRHSPIVTTRRHRHRRRRRRHRRRRRCRRCGRRRSSRARAHVERQVRWPQQMKSARAQQKTNNCGRQNADKRAELRHAHFLVVLAVAHIVATAAVVNKTPPLRARARVSH